ncbi:MAG: glutamine synthetase family protein, partial [Kineosporiaceae bacterium]
MTESRHVPTGDRTIRYTGSGDISDLVRRLSEQDVDVVRVQYADLLGIARSKDVPLRELERVSRAGLSFCQGVFLTTLRADVIDGPGGPSTGLPDLHVHLPPGVVRVVPWEPGVAVAVGDTTTAHGQPAAIGPRNVLARVVERFTERGLSPVIGPELEFYLCRRDEAGRLVRTIHRTGAVYMNGPTVDPGGVLLRMMRQIGDLDLGVFAANHEFSPSQYEINIWHSDAVDAADRCFLLKSSIKDIAALSGLHATFVGKPFNDEGGSGFHLHVSLGQVGRDGNAFDDPAAVDGLSATARHFLGGVLRHADAVSALLNPTVNAYKRLQPDSLAPYRANWGLDNRTTFVRVPPDRGAGTRLELRSGDGTANPYLATAAVLAAGLDGIDGAVEPPPAEDGWTYAAEDTSA